MARTLGECRLDEWWFRSLGLCGCWEVGVINSDFSIRIHYPNGVGALYT